MEHESEALVTQAPGDDLDAALARTVRLFIFQVSRPEEAIPPSVGSDRSSAWRTLLLAHPVTAHTVSAGTVSAGTVT